jgi:hypothetical protein
MGLVAELQSEFAVVAAEHAETDQQYGASRSSSTSLDS